MYLIGGSIPEHDPLDGKLYNTCTVYNPKGDMIATHRKVHLFDIDVPGRIRFQESETLSAGNQLTHVDTGTSPTNNTPFFLTIMFKHERVVLTSRFPSLDFGKIGVGICYDIRFPEQAMIAARRGTDIVSSIPGAMGRDLSRN